MRAAAAGREALSLFVAACRRWVLLHYCRRCLELSARSSPPVAVRRDTPTTCDGSIIAAVAAAMAVAAQMLFLQQQTGDQTDNLLADVSRGSCSSYSGPSTSSHACKASGSANRAVTITGRHFVKLLRFRMFRRFLSSYHMTYW